VSKEALIKAENLRQKGLLEEAADAYEEYLAHAERDIEARRKLAEVLLQLGRKDGAISQYVKVQEALVSSGDVLGAISAGLKAVRIDPLLDNPLAYVAKVQTDELEAKQRQGPETVPYTPARPLSEIQLLSDLDAIELSAVATKMQAHDNEEGDIVFKEGDSGDSLFFVARGLVEIVSGSRKLGRLGRGQCFGEFSFLTGQSRAATVRTLERSELLELSASEMNSVVQAHPRLRDVLYKMYRDRALVNVLSRSPLFEMLGVRDRERIAAKVELETFTAGVSVFRAGEEGGALYIIKSGSVEVRARAPSGEEVKLATLGPHQFVGEVSFLTGVPRTATVTAVEPSELLKLDESELGRLVQDYPSLKDVLKQYHLDRVMSTADTFKSFLRQGHVEGILS
jgi:cAMP-dependent protein kinase regulator